jgi:hypothetical protein
MLLPGKAGGAAAVRRTLATTICRVIGPTQVPRPRPLRDASKVMRCRPAHQRMINRRQDRRASCPARHSLQQSLERQPRIHLPATWKGGHESGFNWSHLEHLAEPLLPAIKAPNVLAPQASPAGASASRPARPRACAEDHAARAGSALPAAGALIDAVAASRARLCGCQRPGFFLPPRHHQPQCRLGLRELVHRKVGRLERRFRATPPDDLPTCAPSLSTAPSFPETNGGRSRELDDSNAPAACGRSCPSAT